MPGGDNLEQALKKVIELDEMAEEYKKQGDEIKDKLELEYKEKLKQMNIEINNKISNYEHKITAEKLQMAEMVSRKIIQSKNEALMKMKENYSDRKEALIKEIFNLIIKESG